MFDDHKNRRQVDNPATGDVATNRMPTKDTPAPPFAATNDGIVSLPDEATTSTNLFFAYYNDRYVSAII